MAHLCMIVHCFFKDESSIYSRMFLVHLPCFNLFCHPFHCCWFERFICCRLRISPQCQVQQNIRSVVPGTFCSASAQQRQQALSLPERIPPGAIRCHSLYSVVAVVCIAQACVHPETCALTQRFWRVGQFRYCPGLNYR